MVTARDLNSLQYMKLHSEIYKKHKSKKLLYGKLKYCELNDNKIQYKKPDINNIRLSKKLDKGQQTKVKVEGRK